MKLLVGSGGVERPATLVGHQEELDGRAEDGTTRGATLIPLATPEHDGGAETQHDGRKSVGQVEADVLLSPDHANLTAESTDVDEEVEPTVDSLAGDGRVDKNTLTRLEGLDVEVLLSELFNDQGVDLGVVSVHAPLTRKPPKGLYVYLHWA